MFNILNVTVLPDPSSYLSRHEEIIHQNNNDEMAHETQSNSSTGSQYLQEVLGDALADALSKVSSGQIGLQLTFNHQSVIFPVIVTVIVILSKNFETLISKI